MSKRKLLLADDSITIQKVVNLTFADEGIEVIAVGDGDSAMRKFDDFMPDLVMADVNMPGLNGYEVCRIIKVTEETKHIPVILLVGSFEPFDEEEAKDAGADDFLTKPFQSIRQLVNKVTDLLSRSALSPEETPAAAPAVDSFAETLEFDEQESPAESVESGASNDFELGRSFSNNFENRPDEISSEFGDAGMDDEMIEASRANDYVADSDSGYQRETTIDYAKTQPLDADDLKGFDMTSGGTGEHQAAETVENQEPQSEAAQAADERSQPASFDEEARKLDQTEDYDDLENYPETQNEAAPQDAVAEREEAPENLTESEPQIDYHLPEEPEFEKEISDAETLAPEVSYEPEEPREADFSQANIEDDQQIEAESSSEAAQTQLDQDADDFNEPEASAETEPETIEKETPETAAAGFVEEPRAAEPNAEFADQEDFESSAKAEIEAEPVNAGQIEAEQTANTEAEPAEIEEPEAAEPETDARQEEEPEIDQEQEAATVEDAPTEPETIDETPISAAANEPGMDFDDGDLLELPPLVEETGIRPQPKAEALVPEIVAAPPAAVAEPESKITVTKTVAESEIALSFPPELIEAIAQAVAEKISARTMTEVLPQITELVMKKLAEDRKK